MSRLQWDGQHKVWRDKMNTGGHPLWEHQRAQHRREAIREREARFAPREVPPRLTERFEWARRPCPACGAHVGQWCRPTEKTLAGPFSPDMLPGEGTVCYWRKYPQYWLEHSIRYGEIHGHTD